MTSRPQSALGAQLIDATLAVNERVVTLRDELDASQLAWIPPEGGWSIGQIFEHLCVAGDSYLDRIRGVIDGARKSGSPGAATAGGGAMWRPTLAGRLLVSGMESTTRKLPAPRMYHPAADPRPDVIDAFLERQRTVVELIRAAESLEWRRLRMRSPVAPLLRMNIGDAFAVVVRHAERHMRQIDQRRAHPAFPRAVAAHR